jgi:3-oxoacyl-[acyl-carrier protein] reductase
VGASFESVYSASKGGLIAFTKALAKELGPSGIRVNCISPGCINTRMMDEYTEEEKAALIEETPLGRIGEPEDVANAVVFLAGDKASFITGQDLGVNGGFVI